MTPAVEAVRRAGLAFELAEYPYDPDAGRIGLQAAQALGEPPGRVLKTLIAEADGRPVCVVLPSDREVSLKRLAAALGARSAALCPRPAAERHSGYRIGGVSPFGLRRRMAVLFDASARDEPYVYVNAGRRGLQLRLDPAKALEALAARWAELSLAPA